MVIRLHLSTVSVLLIFFATACSAVLNAAERGVDFNHDIRPILSATCFKCHGPDEKRREADFRLDEREGAFGVSSSGHRVLVPGDPKGSELFQRITSEDDEERMPPADEQQQLTEDQIDLVRRWISEGAPWQEHWAFTAPQRPKLPMIKQYQWPRNAIDHFILAQLEREGLLPCAEAERRTLIRRVTLDLTGLPPTPQEVTSYLEDRDPNAYEKVVDRLLASPRCGERLAVDWLDAARYADTHGYHEDFHRDMWPWRDWVLQALNGNLPFDQFTVEQLAGDLLPGATTRQRVATGFNRNHGVTASGISEEYRVEYVLDRVKTTSTVWMGLTVGCAQCHDHKYDPITQEEFYRFFAYFNTITDKGVENRTGNVDPLIQVITPLERANLSALEKRIENQEKSLGDVAEQVDVQFAAWERQFAGGSYEFSMPSDGLVGYYPLDETEGEVVANIGGENNGKIRGTAMWAKGHVGGAIRLDGNTDVDLGDTGSFDRYDAFSLGAWVYPECESIVLARIDNEAALRGYEVRVGGGRVDVRLTHQDGEDRLRVITEMGTDAKLSQWSHIFVTYDGSSRGGGVKIYLNGQPQKTIVTQDSLHGSIKTGKPLLVGRRGNRQPLLGLVDEVRIYDRELTEIEVARLAGRDPVPDLLAKSPTNRTQQQQFLRSYYLIHHNEPYRQIADELVNLRKQVRLMRDRLPTVMVMKEMEMPRDTFVLVRGQYDQHGKKVTVGTPAALPPLPENSPASRLGLAMWLTESSHPLVSRVTVNRFWQLAFGTGLVKTSEDFGIQGDPPSHPELLDYLAMEFSDGGWDIKRILKQIMMSATYRQRSNATPELLARDPENRSLARGPRYRLPAEMVRDTALSISGLLIEKVGGPSVRPYQPPNLWIEMSNRGYVQDKGEKLYRRSLYTYIKRAVPPPNMAAMDAPNRETCTVRRQRTSTPLMALVLMNDPTYLEAARVFAQRIMREAGPEPEVRLRFAYALALSREPEADEMSELLNLFHTQRNLYQADTDAAVRLLAVGESSRDESLDVADHAAWMCIASVILNMDETVSKE